MSANGNCGPGYSSPIHAMKYGPREELLYVVCVQTNPEKTQKPDYLATIDVNPDSETYSQVIHRTIMPYIGDELHHSGWNICSSCHSDKPCPNLPKRDKLVLPCLKSDRVYIVDVGKNPRKPELHKIVEPEELHKVNCATPHTAHCLATGEVMISTMGDREKNGKGDFVLLDGQTFEVKGTWTKGPTAKFGYDFWYQPYHDVLVASEWGAPNTFLCGYDPSVTVFGHSLNFYSWKEKKLLQCIDMGEDGAAPLEIRYLHNPKAAQGFVGCCNHSNIYRFFKNEENQWTVEKVIDVPSKKVTNWSSDYLEGCTTDILISLDDRYLYFNNWLHGDVRQYDISNTTKPKLVGQLFLGGKIHDEYGVKVLEDKELTSQPKAAYVKGHRLQAGPQMMQLSLDGKRLYVTSGLFSPLDRQMYPETIDMGSWMVKIDVDVENGGLRLDEEFLVDFGKEPDGPVYAHEIRYPGGDCTSDIWLAQD